MDRKFELTAEYEPAGDQPAAIHSLIESLYAGIAHQTLLGVTGSGKTFTIANVIQELQRPAVVALGAVGVAEAGEHVDVLRF